MKYLDDNGLLYLVQKIKTWLSAKVDKEDGKGLSTNDYTTAEKTKLSGIATGANKTTVENVLTSTSTTNALSANQGKVLNDKLAEINTNIENLGAGDMLKSVYDTDDDGVVDNSKRLSGQTIDYFANKSQLTDVLNSIPTNNNQLTNGAGYQTASDVNAIIETVIGTAPEALDTLKELADALGNDPNFAATITEELAKKVNASDLVAITNAEIDTIVA